MSDAIYLLGDDGHLVDMREQPFETEEFLQRLLADHPELLAGGQFGDGSLRRFLLVSREMGLATEEDGGERWAMDHVFVDQDAILTVVEVKRSSDTRIRREVVGQMLDYAANAVLYLPIERVRSRFEQVHEDPEQQVREFIGDEVDYDGFWESVRTNLQANKIRLVFLSDELPPELRRIIEFLNGNMSSVEVLGVELKQYANGDTRWKTLVPRVVGYTTDAERVKRPHSRLTQGELGDVRDSLVVELSDGKYRITQYANGTVKTFRVESGQEERALAVLKRVNQEKSLGIEEVNAGGTPRNTRQMGDWVLKELRRQGKFVEG